MSGTQAPDATGRNCRRKSNVRVAFYDPPIERRPFHFVIFFPMGSIRSLLPRSSVSLYHVQRLIFRHRRRSFLRFDVKPAATNTKTFRLYPSFCLPFSPSPPRPRFSKTASRIHFLSTDSINLICKVLKYFIIVIIIFTRGINGKRRVEESLK